MRQSGESMAGRISYIDMTRLTVQELPMDAHETLWLRGGLPRFVLTGLSAVCMEQFSINARSRQQETSS